VLLIERRGKATMLPYSKLEYGGIVRNLKKLASRFTARPVAHTPEAVAV
jgi:hypothetical protein